MTDDEIESEILRKYIAQHRSGELADPERRSKCARELDMREVIQSITAESGPELEYTARLWHGRLAPQHPTSKGPLRTCSDSTINKGEHRYHARAFTDGDRALAWERLRDLEARNPPANKVEKEREQKFGILYSVAQEQRDFDSWTTEASGIEGYSIGVIFIDVDDFKALNTKFTESVIDRSVLPALQELLRGMCLHRGAAYRHGGEEIVVLLPNCGLEDATNHAEKLRYQIEVNRFHVDEQDVPLTVSLGVAIWPFHGDSLESVIEKANRAEHVAKDEGKNCVRVASA